MTDAIDPKFLEMFPAWLRSLGEDAAALGTIVESTSSEAVRRNVSVGLNYIFKSLDLIPDGIEDLGFLDDAFVIRVAADLAIKADASAREQPVLARLAHDTAIVSELLGKDYARLVRYVEGLTRGAARGRTVDEILTDEGVRSAFLVELGGWSSGYEAPSFSRDEKNIIKLQSFLGAKLPA